MTNKTQSQLEAINAELLEALKDMQRSLDFSTNGGKSRNRFECELLKVANAAIAKATGETL